jgi:hypothetical protein
MSPTSIGLRVIERLHFNGNKYEFFARTKFAGCLREEGGCLDNAEGEKEKEMGQEGRAEREGEEREREGERGGGGEY